MSRKHLTSSRKNQWDALPKEESNRWSIFTGSKSACYNSYRIVVGDIYLPKLWIEGRQKGNE